MHGGAAGSGAPFGNGNAVKHGFFTSEAIDERKLVRAVLSEAENFLQELKRRRPALDGAAAPWVKLDQCRS